MHEVLEAREVPLGGTRAMLVRRTLPSRTLRTIGPWCFVDHYGPHDVTGGPGMDVPPHPHTGLQTVSWLLAGEVEHRDSVGSLGVQLWVALPDAHRAQAPHFGQHTHLPTLEGTGSTTTVLMGELGGIPRLR